MTTENKTKSTGIKQNVANRHGRQSKSKGGRLGGEGAHAEIPSLFVEKVIFTINANFEAIKIDGK